MVFDFGLLKAEKKILVVGDIMVDDYYFCERTHRRTDNNSIIYKLKKRDLIFGGAGNVWQNLKGLNCDPYLCGAVGTDEYSDFILSKIKEKKYIFYTQRTTVKHRGQSNNKLIYRIDDDFISNISKKEYDLILYNLEKDIQSFDAIIISDYKKGFCKSYFIKRIIALANKFKIFIAVDSKEKNLKKYKDASLLKVNEQEFECLFGKHIKECTKYEITNFLFSVNIEELLVTLGSKGMMLINREGERWSIKVDKLRNANSVGAGDCVLAGYVVALLSNLSEDKRLSLCKIMADYCVSKRGTCNFDLKDYGNYGNDCKF